MKIIKMYNEHTFLSVACFVFSGVRIFASGVSSSLSSRQITSSAFFLSGTMITSSFSSSAFFAASAAFFAASSFFFTASSALQLNSFVYIIVQVVFVLARTNDITVLFLIRQTATGLGGGGITRKQECIPVGCIPSAAEAILWW